MPYRNYPPLLDSGRNPFELFILGFSLVTTLPLMWGSPPPASTTALLGPFLVHVWAGILAVGCAVALVGVFWTGLRHVGHWNPTAAGGLLIEGFGLVAVGVGDIIFAVAAFGLSNSRGVVAGGIVLGFALACLWRSWLIKRWVRAVVEGPPDGDR